MDRRLLLGILALVACGPDAVTPGEYPPSGQVRFIVAVDDTGTADLDGYVLRYGDNSMPIRQSGLEFTHPDLPLGPLTTSLDSVAPWCVVTPPTQIVEVVQESVTEVRFDVACARLMGVARVIVTSTAVDAADPDGYAVVGPSDTIAVSPNDTIYLSVPAELRSTITLSGIAPWCTNPQPDRAVDAVAGDTVTIAFTVSCATAYRTTTVTLAALGTGSGQMLAVTIGGTTPLRLTEGHDTTLVVRMDRAQIRVDSISRTCVPFLDTAPALTLDPAGAVTLNHLRIGCGRLSGLSERTFQPMVLLETGLDGRDTVVLGEGLNHPYDAKLSRDGAWIVGEQYQVVLNPTRLEWRSYREAVDGNDYKVLVDWTTDRITFPSWGPDDQHLMSILNWGRDTSRLVLTDRDGANPDTLDLPQNPRRAIVRAAWSPSGSRLAYAGFCSQTGLCGVAITIISPGDPSATRILPTNFTSGELAWSPDETKLAYVGTGGRIHVIDIASGAVTQLVHSSSQYQDEAPEWDPSGELIGYVRVDPDENQQPFHWAFVVPADGGPEFKIVQQRMFVGPFWTR